MVATMIAIIIVAMITILGKRSDNNSDGDINEERRLMKEES